MKKEIKISNLDRILKKLFSTLLIISLEPIKGKKYTIMPKKSQLIFQMLVKTTKMNNNLFNSSNRKTMMMQYQKKMSIQKKKNKKYKNKSLK